MNSLLRRSVTPMLASLLLLLALIVSGEKAHAQCGTIKVTNNLQCGVSLCLYNNSAAAFHCWDVPAGATVLITLPAGFVPHGGVSASGARYPFPATGCTVCYSQRTFLPVICCGVVCYNSATCTITIDQCSTPQCHP